MSDKSKSDQLAKVFELATTLYHLDDFEVALHTISRQAAVLLNADDSAILMVNPRTHHTVKTVYREVQTGAKYRNLHSLFTGWILKYNQSLFICGKYHAILGIHTPERDDRQIIQRSNVKPAKPLRAT